MPTIKLRKAYNLHKNLGKRWTIKKSLVSLLLLPLAIGVGIFAFSSTPTYASLSSALVGDWRFNEGTGTTAADSSIEGNNGTIVKNGSSPAWVTPGHEGSGSALQFNGAGAQGAAGNTVNAGNDASLDGLSRYILSAWVKFDPGYVGNSGTWANIIGRTQGTNFSYMLYINANGHLRAHHVQSNGGVILYDSASVIPTGQWVHIQQIADGGRIRLVINGVDDPNSATYDGTAISRPTANTYIGQDTREYTLLGAIDDARIYSDFEAPGGVGGAALWLKADSDVVINGSNQVEQWNDESGSGLITNQARAASTDVSSISASNNILRVENGINFNPAIDFAGVSNYALRGSASTTWNSVANLNTFAVSSTEGSSPGSLSGLFTTNGSWTNGANVGRGLLATTPGNSYMLDGAGCSPGATTASTKPHIARGTYVATNTTAGGSTWLDGVKEKDTGGCSQGTGGANFEIGGRTGDTGYENRVFNGKIPEVVVYKSALTAQQAQRIDSYLAIKYGITLNSSTLDYLASDGTTKAWNAAANAGYYHNVFGIGRDDSSDLNQKQSKSVNPQGILTVGNGVIASDNTSNSNNFSANKSFMMIGDDDNAANTWVSTGVVNTTLANYKRVPRTWKVQETGTVGNVTVGLDTADPDANVPDAINKYYLLRDSNNNGSFADETPIQMTDNGGGQFSVAGVNFNNGELFTFATFANEYRVDIQPVDNLTGEDGDTGTFKVKLGARPTAAVTVTFTSSNINEGTVPVSITIQPNDWDNYDANVVTVTGVDDSPPVGDGAVPYTIVTTDVTSADTNYNNLDGSNVDDVAMFNQNNDPPGINLSLLSGNTTTEAGGCVAVRFELLSQPTAAVTIPVSLDDATEGTLNGVTQITIQPANWDQPQNNEVEVCGLADGASDGDIPYNLVTGDPTSGDAGYDAISATQVADVVLVNQDIDIDGDGDGVYDTEENGAPNGGDANNDGTPDRQQSNVTSFVSGVTGNYATLQIDSGCQILTARVTAEAAQAVVDPNYDYPYGLMNFQADCGAVGFTATVQQRFYGTPINNLIARKHNPTTSEYFTIDGATIDQQTIGGQILARATFQITDGSSLDTDGSANGTIVDPAGLALQLPSAPNAGGGLSNTGTNMIGIVGAAITALAIGGYGLFKQRRVSHNS